MNNIFMKFLKILCLGMNKCWSISPLRQKFYLPDILHKRSCHYPCYYDGYAAVYFGSWKHSSDKVYRLLSLIYGK